MPSLITWLRSLPDFSTERHLLFVMSKYPTGWYIDTLWIFCSLTNLHPVKVLTSMDNFYSNYFSRGCKIIFSDSVIPSACLLAFCKDELYAPFLESLWTMDSFIIQFSSVQSLSRVRHFATPWITARQASLSITNSGSSLRLMSIESVMPSSHLILCRPLLLLPPIPPSIRVFSNESTLLMRWPEYWSSSFSIIPSKEIPGLISFRMDWLDLLAVQGTLKTLLQHHSSKASILRRSTFFTVQLSHPYMTTGKTRALTIQLLSITILILLGAQIMPNMASGNTSK